jgi:PHD/YefM family antitoxin component YafN of YafNO toxin-antitoxin module
MASNARYLVSEDDFAKLLAMLEVDPRRDPANGVGGPRVMSELEQGYQNTAHRFYNYQIHEWIRAVKGK